MRIERINDTVSFGIYIKEDPVNHVVGKYRDYNIEIYTDKENGKIQNKLYYVSDKLLNWIKSKLVMFKNGKKYKEIRNSR